MKVRKFQKVCEIIEANDRKSSRLIPILQAVQEEYRYLPEEILTFIATALNISPAKVFGVATFYSHFTLKPKGKYIVRVCDGTACVEVCPVDCIHPRKDEQEFEAATQLYINPDECIDCGACQPACPVEAIYRDDQNACA